MTEWYTYITLKSSWWWRKKVFASCKLCLFGNFPFGSRKGLLNIVKQRRKTQIWRTNDMYTWKLRGEALNHSLKMLNEGCYCCVVRELFSYPFPFSFFFPIFSFQYLFQLCSILARISVKRMTPNLQLNNLICGLLTIFLLFHSLHAEILITAPYWRVRQCLWYFLFMLAINAQTIYEYRH